MAVASAGDIVISTRIDLKQFEKELKELDKYQINEKKLKLQLDKEKLKPELEKFSKEMDKLQEENNEKWSGLLKEKYINTDEFKDWQNRYRALEEQYAPMREQYADIFNQLKIIDNYLAENQDLIVKEKEEIKEATKETYKQAEAQKQVTKEVEKTAVKQKQAGISKTLDDVKEKSNGLGKALSSVGKVIGGIAIAGTLLVGAIGLASNKSETITQVVQKIQAMVDVLVNRLVTMIEPFVVKLLPLVERVLTLIFEIAEALDKVLGPVLNAIIDAVGWIIDGLGWLVNQILSLLGIDISSETKQFAKDINEASKGLKTTNKEVSKLRKQLLGFDEMNILNKDTGSVGALGSLGGSGKNDLKDDVDDTRDAFDKLGDKMDELGDYKFDKGFSNELGVAGGVIKLDKAGEELVKYAKDFSIFYDTAKSITEKNGMMKIVSWTGETISIAKKDFQSLVDDMNKHVISKKNINLWKQVGKAINDINVKRFSITQKAISQGFKDAMIEFKDGLVYVKLITGETIIYTEDEFEKLKPYVKSVASSVVQTTNETTQHIKENVSGVNVAVNSALAGIEESSGKSSDKTQKDWINVGGVVVGAFDGPSGVSGAVKGAFTGIETQGKKTADEIKETYKNLPDELKKYLDPNWFYPQLQEQGAGVGVAVGSAITGGMVTTINGDLGVIEKSVNSALGVLRQLLNSFSAGVGGAVGAAMLGISTSKIQQAKNQIKNITLPRIKLAKGGIVNRVGKGIPIGNAIVGERGREGVIPLTDNQQMALLGREIAKNVVINLTNVTELDGRQLAKSVTQVMNDMNFASNGGVI